MVSYICLCAQQLPVQGRRPLDTHTHNHARQVIITVSVCARSNYQSKDVAHVMKSLAQKVADKARSSSDARCRQYARMALEGLPRGGGNG